MSRRPEKRCTPIKRTPLARKTPLRAAVAATRAWVNRSRVAAAQRARGKPRSALPQRSDRQRQRDAGYLRERARHLAIHPDCVACAQQGKRRPATEVHHRQGRDKRRSGDLTTDASGFVGLCLECHRAVHADPVRARALGLSASRHIRRGGEDDDAESSGDTRPADSDSAG